MYDRVQQKGHYTFDFQVRETKSSMLRSSFRKKIATKQDAKTAKEEVKDVKQEEQEEVNTSGENESLMPALTLREISYLMFRIINIIFSFFC